MSFAFEIINNTFNESVNNSNIYETYENQSIDNEESNEIQQNCEEYTKTPT